ncbi:MAG: hypothetical protein J2P28_20315, partial [Actinobacteria bacterium]|nr:hypothetical protein [Actinomycetota bacterium]
MAPDLKDQIHSFFETGLLPVDPADIASRHRPVTTLFPFKARSIVTPRRATAVGVALAAACAAALV